MRLLLASACLLLLAAVTAHANPSSFQRSCDDVRLEATANEAFIFAQCRDRQGNYHDAEFRLIGYVNNDGYLNREGFQNSSFQRSCDQFWLEVNHGMVALHGNCRRRNGSYVESWIELENIDNDNGRLVGF